MKTILILVLLVLVGCNTKHEVRYVVTVGERALISYTDDLGNTSLAEHGGVDTWDKSIIYDKSKVDGVKMVQLQVKSINKGYNNITAKVYVDGQLVVGGNDPEIVVLSYVIDKKQREVLSNH